MADPVKAQKIQVEVPEGMTPERLVELVTNYEEKRVKNKARQDARKSALNVLKEKYKKEYDAEVAKNMPKS
jgi:hypothetical protein